jgi:hypothetical protein
MSDVVVKQGKPSKPGEKIDTSKATVVPPSSEVKQEAAAREVAAQRKASQKKIDGLAKKMTHPARAKDEAVKAVTGEGKAKAAAKPRSAGNGSGPTTRITESWKGADGKEVNVKDHVAHGEFVGVVKGRWTKRKGDQLVPMVTLTLDKPKDKDKPRHNAPAAEVTHVK